MSIEGHDSLLPIFSFLKFEPWELITRLAWVSNDNRLKLPSVTVGSVFYAFARVFTDMISVEEGRYFLNQNPNSDETICSFRQK